MSSIKEINRWLKNKSVDEELKEPIKIGDKVVKNTENNNSNTQDNSNSEKLTGTVKAVNIANKTVTVSVDPTKDKPQGEDKEFDWSELNNLIEELFNEADDSDDSNDNYNNGNILDTKTLKELDDANVDMSLIEQACSLNYYGFYDVVLRKKYTVKKLLTSFEKHLEDAKNIANPNASDLMAIKRFPEAIELINEFINKFDSFVGKGQNTFLKVTYDGKEVDTFMLNRYIGDSIPKDWDNSKLKAEITTTRDI